MIPFYVPDISDAEKKAVIDVLDSSWITTGPVAHTLEDRVKTLLDSRFAIAVSSASMGILIALKAAGVSSGDEVIIPTFTFAATANAVIHAGATPVFADSLPSGNINPDHVLSLISERTKAIIPVHFAGLPANMKALRSIADSHNLVLIEDAAHAFGSRYSLDGPFVGASSPFAGDMTVFSLYATKNITSAEGGIITTSSRFFADKIRILYANGIDRSFSERYHPSGNIGYSVVEPGWKANLPDVLAAIAVAQLKRWQYFRARRAYIARQYARLLGNYVGLPSYHLDALDYITLHLFTVMVPQADSLANALRDSGIGVSRHFHPLHLFPAFSHYAVGNYFDVAEDIWKHSISLPFFTKMTDNQIASVVDALLDFM